MSNTNLTKAKKAKCDEFYTQYADIEKELQYYNFEDKIVYCNCDHPIQSNFVKYFCDNYHKLKLKGLISTFYSEEGKSFVYRYDGLKESKKDLNGNGSYDSEECIKLLEECDVVVTNPPFSLFRNYVKQLMDYNKKFLIIGNINAVGWKETFPYIKDNLMWWGFNSITNFNTKNGVEKVGCRWYTNIGHSKRNEEIDLYRKYDTSEYIKYENYDAIDCPKVSDIPIDYNGVIGVPISFLDTYCPNQFEIIGVNNDSNILKKLGVKPIGVNGIELMKSQGGTAHLTPNSVELYFIENGKFKKPFARLLIKKR